MNEHERKWGIALACTLILFGLVVGGLLIVRVLQDMQAPDALDVATDMWLEPVPVVTGAALFESGLSQEEILALLETEGTVAGMDRKQRILLLCPALDAGIWMGGPVECYPDWYGYTEQEKAAIVARWQREGIWFIAK